MDGWHLRKLATEADEIAQLHRRSDVTLQLLENLGCRKILALFGIIGQVEIEIEILINRRNHLKLSVARKRLRVYTIVDFSFIRTFAPSF